MKEIRLHDYTIIIDEHLSNLRMWLSVQEYKHFLILVDENTKRDCWPILKKECPLDNFEIIEIKSGEVYKNLDTCSQIWEQLLDFKTDRKALFINLGGGVIGDMGGFAASCYKRGIDFLNIPTTVLSQVDASIGGKLGVDFKNGKNLIGLFKNPQRVHIATCFHQSLPKKQIKNGLAEIYKHALIADANQWINFMRDEDFFNKNSIEVLYHSLMVKQRIVAEDPFENGIRKALNFGHTIGHAIETYSLENDTSPLLHGEAIIIGMIAEAFLSTKKCGLKQQHLSDISRIFMERYTPYRLNENSFDTIWDYMLLDKKNKSTQVLAVLLKDIGIPVLDVEIKKKDLIEALDYYKSIVA